MFEQHHFNCQCTDHGHAIRFTFDPQSGDVYLSVHLMPRGPWWKRLWAVGLYLLGRPAAYGHFDETLLCPEDFSRLHGLLDRAELKATERRIAALSRPQEKRVLHG